MREILKAVEWENFTNEELEQVGFLVKSIVEKRNSVLTKREKEIRLALKEVEKALTKLRDLSENIIMIDMSSEDDRDWYIDEIIDAIREGVWGYFE